MCIRDRYQRRVRGHRLTSHSPDFATSEPGSSMGWIRPNVCSLAFICSLISLALTMIGMMCAITGMAILPKCRYGEPDCYFSVTNCAYTKPTESSECIPVLKMRAIEGSSDYSAEQLAIPILATCLASIPAMLTFLGTMLDNTLPLLETSKIFLAMNTVFLVLGTRAIQDLTFDCRWWGNQHHHNADACHQGFNLYVAAAIILSVAQVALLIISVRFVENERYMMVETQEMDAINRPDMGMNDDESMANL
eukprot:TRINITY_DN667_c0_g1_i1.p1 TRINITY_DN667_c0_g1~~TRINITY_DN667_c0_g1_i1.p1  ORF type:complete len:250 (-),score=74.55 TRINITY_DN667_c0_g1_i1:193-942(-)